MFYIDTSVLVAALTNEPEAERAKAFLVSAGAGDLGISSWTMAEFSSALAMKLRLGQMDRTARNAVLTGFSRLVADSFQVLAVTPQDFSTAARFCDHADPGIRAGDALHLAVAIANGAMLVTIDRKLHQNALAAGASSRVP